MAAGSRAPSSRRWRGRARFALALLGSLLLHAGLKRGLERTTLGTRPAGELLAPWQRDYAPALASDFPLQDDSRTRDSLPHEQPIEAAPDSVEAAPPGRRADRGAVIGPAASTMPGDVPDVPAEAIDRKALASERVTPAPIDSEPRALEPHLAATLPEGESSAEIAPVPEAPLEAEAASAGQAPPDGDLPAPPRMRRSPARGSAGALVARPPATALDSTDPGAETLSVAALVPALVPRAGTAPGDAAAGLPVAPPAALPRSGPSPLPPETRVRETAAAFAKRDPRSRPASPADGVVDRGLAWLARTQSSDGHWSLGAYDPAGAGGRVRLQSDTAATGLALLAFLGAGHDHFDGPHRDTVRRGLEWLVSVQKEDGDLFVPSDPVSNSCAWLYSHGIATTALCEAVGMTGDPRLRPAAGKAIGFIAAAQQPGRGGWRYLPRGDSDLSVSGWMVVALRSGVLAGLEVPPETLAGVGRLLDASALPGEPGGFVYNTRDPGQRPTDQSGACMTALGTLMRLHTGTPRDDAAVIAAGARLGALRPTYGKAGDRNRDAYLWYYSSQVLVHVGGNAWDPWYRQLTTLLEARQTTRGPDAGSWEPLGAIPDRWGPFGGRLYVTALHLLALEVPYRHLPTLDAAITAGE